MRVFFSTSPKAKQEYQKEISAIYSFLNQENYKLTETYIEKISINEFYDFNEKQRKKYYKDTIKSINTSDICIFEASYPSLGVGHLINQCLKLRKPTIVLHLKNHKPFMLESADNENIVLIEYTISNLNSNLFEAINYASNQKDSRFNMMLNTDLSNYLDHKSEQQKISKAEYIRKLIIKDKSDKI